MADTYILWSTAVRNITKEEREWIEKKANLAFCPSCNDNVSQNSDGFCDKCGSGCDTALTESESTWPGFDWAICGDTFHAYSNGGYSVDDFAEFMMEFLRLFRRDQIHMVPYAYTCSKPRPDNFGGGIVGISANEVIWRCSETLRFEVERMLKQKPTTAEGE